MQALLDTNILLDLYLERKPFAEDAQTLIKLQQSGKYKGYITSITVLNLYYIAKKILGDGKARIIYKFSSA